MATKKPWLVPGVPWKTEAAFISWVRGVLRRGWANHPVKIEYLNKMRKRIKNDNPKSAKAHPTVWGYICEQCHQEVKAGDIEVDHAGTEQGTFTSLRDIQAYAEHLFLVDFDSLEVCCKPCHKTRTLAQAKGMSFEDAKIEQEIISICKRPAKEIIAFAQDYGYNPSQLSNPDKRRAAVSKILRSV